MAKFDIEISEVGPRDGLQSISTIMPTADKLRWIDALAAAGIPEIEVGSFVPAKVLPQLADTAEVARYAKEIAGLSIAVLVPNLRGAQNAIEVGPTKMSIPFSVSETHSLRNVKRTHQQMLEEVKRIAELLKTLPQGQRPKFEGGLATAFGCTIEGAISEDKVVELAVALMEAGCDEVGLSDTTGSGNPAQVKRLVKKVWAAVGKENLTGIHLHNTRGQGLANALAAVEVGITTVDSSMGGIGGCPAAPGASGNIVTEDLVFMLEAMGLKTGIDFERMFAARKILAKLLPNEPLYGFTPDAGFPKGFQRA
ncbi:hydroxymethylglutaryl-CoA lyase [Paraglaciecola arctica]|uniref:hydroxymethylglutaryl-CoA lyase n=1 Tax=Paraglaciecola arctica TaxID=1128911 RepID=UPI001C06A8E3|nr:hydroxymethylglutaryl-CoA lyase [Paraglaciecola arctica]MBU3002622.1 hydroxymethylglutaryl-CoA lyase [Paraglaciecola arctica]